MFFEVVVCFFEAVEFSLGGVFFFSGWFVWVFFLVVGVGTGFGGLFFLFALFVGGDFFSLVFLFFLFFFEVVYAVVHFVEVDDARV